MDLLINTLYIGSCVDAGFTDCCVTDCLVDGVCYCDSICYSLQDCCEDVEETCERPGG